MPSSDQIAGNDTPPALASKAVPLRYRIEWPTWLLIAGIYTSWGALLLGSEAWPWPIRYGLMSLLLAWHSSMVHELIHGHPTRVQAVNDALAFLPLSLLPYHDYKATHIRHHTDADLTRPAVDPESYLLHPERYQALGAAGRWLARANMTLLGRLLMLAPRAYWGVGRRAFAALKSGSLVERARWVADLSGMVVVLLLVSASDFPFWGYLAAAVSGSMLIGLRAFYEHRPHPAPAARSVVVETAAPLAWLFLHNNLHAVHHRYPGMAWYLLPGAYRANRAATLRANQGFHFRGYGTWAKYLFTPVMSPQAPDDVLGEQAEPPGSA